METKTNDDGISVSWTSPLTNTAIINGVSLNPDTISGTSATPSSFWSNPIRVDVIEGSDCIEMIYKQRSMGTLTTYPSPPPEERVFKIVYSCVDGKWHKSERIYGKIIPAQAEHYEFE